MPLFLPEMAGVDQWGECVAASQSSPQTVRTDSAVRGASGDQCRQTGSNYICCRWWVPIIKYCMKNSYHATKRTLWFEGFVASDLVFRPLLSVLPGLAERLQLMTLWSECSGSAGLFHTTLDRVFKHMNQRYTAVLQERHPHSADTGWIISILVTLVFNYCSVSTESLVWFVNQL